MNDEALTEPPLITILLSLAISEFAPKPLPIPTSKPKPKLTPEAVTVPPSIVMYFPKPLVPLVSSVAPPPIPAAKVPVAEIIPPLMVI